MTQADHQPEQSRSADSPIGPAENNGPVVLHSKGRLFLLLLPFILSNIAIFVGMALAPVLILKSPILLVALAPIPRHLVLIPDADPVPYYFIGVLRLFIVDPFMYQLGREYGPEAVIAFQRRFPSTASTINLFERLFQRAGVLLVFLFSAPLICLLAGVSGMKVRVFVVTSIVGSIVFLWALRALGEAFSTPLGLFRAFMEQHIIAATILSIAMVALTAVQYARKREPDAPKP